MNQAMSLSLSLCWLLMESALMDLTLEASLTYGSGPQPAVAYCVCWLGFDIPFVTNTITNLLTC